MRTVLNVALVVIGVLISVIVPHSTTVAVNNVKDEAPRQMRGY